MDRNQSNFGDELKSMKDEVDLDIGKILEMAKADSSSTDIATPKSATKLQTTSDVHPPRKSARLPAIDGAPNYATPQNEPRINVTTRLTQRVNELLTEAALRQRLKKQRPDTRQGIVEQAILLWLNENTQTT